MNLLHNFGLKTFCIFGITNARHLFSCEYHDPVIKMMVNDFKIVHWNIRMMVKKQMGFSKNPPKTLRHC